MYQHFPYDVRFVNIGICHRRFESLDFNSNDLEAPSSDAQVWRYDCAFVWWAVRSIRP
jgi:hypothetical protein